MPKVIYFSVVREKVGKGEEEVDFRGPVGKLREFLKERYPEISPILDVVRFAVNEEYVDDDFNLEGEERVAVIPPVSGG